MVEARSGPWGTYDRETLVELYKMWGSTYRVSQITGIPPATVRRWLKHWGVKMRKPGGGPHRALPHLELEKTAFLYTRVGLSINEIAEVMELDSSTVWDRLDAAGVERRSVSEAVRLRFDRRPRASGRPIEVVVT